MKPVVAGVALEYRDTFTFARLDVNTEPQKTRQYNIRGTPTYIVFRDGEIAGAFSGSISSNALVARIFGILELEATE